MSGKIYGLNRNFIHILQNAMDNTIYREFQIYILNLNPNQNVQITIHPSFSPVQSFIIQFKRIQLLTVG